MARLLHTRPAATGAHRRTALVAAVLGCAVLVAAGCSSSSSSSSGSSGTASSRRPEASSFSGQLPSALASANASVLESVSAAAASASAAAASFEASVSAQIAAGRSEAKAVLDKTQGAGNAISDVTITGLPKAQAAGFNAALVTVLNNTQAKASYAIKVEFSEQSGKVVDTTYLNVKDLAAGATATPTAFSSLDRDQALVSRVVQAQRY
ncbi:hypothetical protein ACIRVF_04160 [Kitasatospora sp. NPDC101157]|uniref:hypothetical protein n=1 Tax=Kitasatospora sp. NPDC101157 TaxID=3364098 RepID=UPI003801DF72